MNNKVLITGTDDEGFFTAANAYSIDEFMHGNSDFLERAIGSTLFYGKVYE